VIFRIFEQLSQLPPQRTLQALQFGGHLVVAVAQPRVQVVLRGNLVPGKLDGPAGQSPVQPTSVFGHVAG
jgi:hypothetical protein